MFYATCLVFKNQNQKKALEVLPCGELSWAVITVFASVNSDVYLAGWCLQLDHHWRKSEGVVDDSSHIEWPCFWDCIYCTSSWTMLLVGENNMSWEKQYECEHSCHFYFFQHKAELFYCFYSTLQFLSCFLAYILTESGQVFSPCQAFQQSSFCSPLVYRSSLVFSSTLTASLFLWVCVATWNLADSA